MVLLSCHVEHHVPVGFSTPSIVDATLARSLLIVSVSSLTGGRDRDHYNDTYGVDFLKSASYFLQQLTLPGANHIF